MLSIGVHIHPELRVDIFDDGRVVFHVDGVIVVEMFGVFRYFGGRDLENDT